jgi:hypothetical protein
MTEKEFILNNIIKEIHPQKNQDLDVKSLTPSSGRKIWWLCKKGHEWKSLVSNRVNHQTGCPHCKKGKTFKLPLIVDTRPDLIKELHPTKNKKIDFYSLTGGSEKRITWLCKNGHEWETSAAQRVKANTGCPYCSGKLPTQENNLLKYNSRLCEQWDYEKNGDLIPENFVPGSQKKVWWNCIRGHSWQASIYNRAIKYTGCPNCNSGTSQFELRIYSELKSIFKDATIHEKIDGFESDIFIEQYNLGIDYDALYTHKSTKRIDFDKKKIDHFKSIGMLFIKVREIGLPSLSKNEVYVSGIVAELEHVKKILKFIISNLELKKRHQRSIKTYLKKSKFQNHNLFLDLLYMLPNPIKEKTLSYLYPDIIKEWHPTKNGALKPDNVSGRSNFKVWWRCKNKHEWYSSVDNRAYSSHGCPYCSRKRVTKETSLLATHPNIAKSWHPIKNGSLNPDQVLSGTSKKAWWLCSKGHEWEAMIYSRVKHGCSFCSGKYTSKEKSIVKTNPNLAKQWHPTKNGDKKPTQYSSGSRFKAWWQCSESHIWQAGIYSRKKNGCPYCSGRLVSKEKNLKVDNPALASQWHPIKNGKLKATDVTKSSSKKVWWICKNSHEWISSVNNRTNKINCPHCVGNIVSKYNNLEIDNPKISKQWHPTKNGKLKPVNFTKGSGKKVWWLCKNGHEWEATIHSRSRRELGCPHCRNFYKPKISETHPEIAKQWHPTKNGNLTPSDFSFGMKKKVWWLCPKGHTYDAMISKRCSGSGCGYCTGFKIGYGNDFKSLYPKIAKQWHPTKNGDLKPQAIVKSSRKIAWWICSEGHQWKKEVRLRTQSKNRDRCPACSKKS